MSLDEEIQELERRWVELFDKRPRTPFEDQEKERIGGAFERALRQEVKPLANDLAKIGIYADIWDLVNTSASYPDAIPILVKHLSRPYHHRNKEGIVRALAVKEAKGIANNAIMEEYRKAPKEDPGNPWKFHFRWAFGNTMRVIVTEDDLEQLIDIVLDETNGDSRDMFVRALAKLKSPRVREVLNQLAADKSKLVAEEAQKALKRKRPAN
jgi:hypothetical protein